MRTGLRRRCHPRSGYWDLAKSVRRGRQEELERDVPLSLSDGRRLGLGVCQVPLVVLGPTTPEMDARLRLMQLAYASLGSEGLQGFRSKHERVRPRQKLGAPAETATYGSGTLRNAPFSMHAYGLALAQVRQMSEPTCNFVFAMGKSGPGAHAACHPGCGES